MGGYVGLGTIVGYDDCGMHTTIEVHLTFSEAFHLIISVPYPNPDVKVQADQHAMA